MSRIAHKFVVVLVLLTAVAVLSGCFGIRAGIDAGPLKIKVK